jgi:hypothetical protein
MNGGPPPLDFVDHKERLTGCFGRSHPRQDGPNEEFWTFVWNFSGMVLVGNKYVTRGRKIA